MTDKKQMHLGFFTLPEPTHGGQWAYPGNESERIGDVDFWAEMVEVLEDAKLDLFFFGDSYGYNMVNGARTPVASTDSLDLPRMSPDILIGALSQRAKHIGFVETASTTFEPPYSHAKRIGTLDHVTKGRFGWNIVTTSWAESSAAGFGVPLTGHDDRYAMAEDHANIVYQLLEESWDDGALVLDRERRIFADPAKIRPVDYEGQYYRSHGVGNTHPSIQRLPVIFQAGTSGAGVKFGAKWAEVAFIIYSTDEAAKRTITNYKQQAAAYGRNPDHLRYITGISFIIGDTTAEAKAKHAEIIAMNTYEAAVAGYANFTGLDLTSYDPNTSVKELLGKGQMFSQVERYYNADPNATVGDIIEGHRQTMGPRSVQVFGTVDEVAHRMEQLVDEVGFDGFLIEPYVVPEDAYTIRDVLIPELRKRGRFRHEYEEDTLRERLFGKGQVRLFDDYPARHQAR